MPKKRTQQKKRSVQPQKSLRTLSITELLQRLKEKRDCDQYADEYPQKVLPSEKKSGHIPTLDRRSVRKTSAMLAERFPFAGRWSNASIAETWLSLADMRKAATSRIVRKRVKCFRDYWDESAPATYPDRQLSLFSADQYGESCVFLVWPIRDGDEPRIATYLGQGETWFDDLHAYLRFLNGEKKRRW